jgi:hypothetical protein
VVRRSKKGLNTVPYSKAYEPRLSSAGESLRAAAASYACGKAVSGSATAPSGPAVQCRCADLVEFLRARAQSFADDNYLTSEILWVTARSCPLDVAIGPYEYYEDRLLGLKTAFEAIVYLRDDTESARFRGFLKHIDGMVANLPIPADLRGRFLTIKPSPITIGNVLYTAGDARSGYQVRAFVLPNDESVRRARGTKNVVLRDVVKAKFDALVRPVANGIFGRKLRNKVSFQAYYDILLAWQLAHSVVPSTIELPDGSKTTAHKQLRARHTLMELVKSEAIALLNYSYLRDRGEFRKRSDTSMAATFLASFFVAARLGEDSPQTIAKVIIYNYLAKEWVFRYNADKRYFEVNSPNLQAAVRKLVGEVLQIIGRGDYGGAGRLISRFGVMSGEVRMKLEALSKLPVGILPRYKSMPAG